MTQTDFGTINPTTKSGTALASDLNNWRDSVHSMHSGSSRPSYAVAGMEWLDTSGTDPLVYYYTGSADVRVYEVDISDSTIRTVFSSSGAAYLKGGTTNDVYGFVSGTEVIRMDANGFSVFAGAPAYALDVRGDVGIKVNGVGVVDAMYLNNTNASGTATRIIADKALVLSADYNNNTGAPSSYMAFETDGTERLRIEAGGNIVIAALPTSAPGTSGALWNDSGTVKVVP